VVITISHLGYIKRTSATEYRQQRRGGRGAIGGKTRDEDYIEHLFVASTHHTMIFFTEKGRCYWLNVYEIPEGDKTSKGRAIQNLIQLPPDDKVRAILDVKDLKDEAFVNTHHIVLCTKQGVIKKTSLQDSAVPVRQCQCHHDRGRRPFAGSQANRWQLRDLAGRSQWQGHSF